MSEILTTIKLIKFYTWENYYRKKINQMREKENFETKRELGYKIINFTIVFGTPAICVSVAIAVNHALGSNLTASTAFTLLYLSNTLRYPLLFLPEAERSLNGNFN